MTTPLVSICIPTYNGATYLSESLDSALAQSFRDIEVLVVDDASTDDTIAVARGHARIDPRIRIVRNQRNLGLVANWNHTVELAQGEWIKFLHQDDRLEPECVARMLEAATPGVDLVAARRHLLFNAATTDEVKAMYHRYVAEHDLARRFPGKTHIPPEEFGELLLRVPDGNCIGEPTATMVRRSAFARYGYFHPELVLLVDWEYWARLAANTGLCYVDEPLAHFRVHAKAATARVRSGDQFRGFHLDPLIILHDMTYSPRYSRLQGLARSRIPPVDLKRRLSDQVRATRWVARHENGGDRRKTMAQWWATVRRHPRLLAFLPAYVARVLLKKAGLRAGI